MKCAFSCVFLIAACLLYPSARAQTLNIVGSLQFTPQFSAFWNFAQPIRNELDTPGPISVFAPTNLAVQQFISTLPPGFSDPEAIRNVLLYHVVFGYVLLENITEASPMLTLNNALLNISLVGTSVAIDNYAVILGQFPQVNGNIFTINKVLIPPGVTFATMQVTSAQPTMEVTSAMAVTSAVTESVPPTETSQATEVTVPAPPQQVALCTSQECCTSRAFPNFITGDGFLEFNPICNDGGLHCDDETGCLLCHDPAINLNIFNRPLCNVSTVEPYIACINQACCTARMVPNPMTGYGYLEFVQSCIGGGENCFDETGCIDCFNPLPGTNNFLNRPVCSAEAILSFGLVPQTELVALETSAVLETSVIVETAASTIIVDGSTAPARRSLLGVESDASLVFPALFGMLAALLAIF